MSGCSRRNSLSFARAGFQFPGRGIFLIKINSPYSGRYLKDRCDWPTIKVRLYSMTMWIPSCETEWPAGSCSGIWKDTNARLQLEITFDDKHADDDCRQIQRPVRNTVPIENYRVDNLSCCSHFFTSIIKMNSKSTYGYSITVVILFWPVVIFKRNKVI